MRLITLSLLVMVVLVGAALVPGAGAQAAGTADAPAALSLHQSTRAVPQHDDSRVDVQLVVAGIAAGLVVGVGTGAYLLRRKLGLTAYSPDDAAAGGHH